jgi:peroxiredoxin
MKYWQLPLLLSFMLGCSSPAQTGSSPSGNSGEVTQKIKAPNFELRDINGNRLALGDFKGKVVFLDFWATWCPPCILSLPEVEKLVDDYKSKQVEIISLSLDTNEEIVRKFMQAHKITSHVAVALDSGVEMRYNVNGIPAFFIIDKEGMVVDAWQGYHPSMPQSWRKELNRLLGA